MSEKDLSKALRNIIEKELKSLSKLLPKDVISNIEKKISPQIEEIIEQNGYVKKSKYDNLERIIDDLEERVKDLEKD
jgi:polyhydroxyalkanoate synthesis regulator phasin|tara:strand:- start:723 stop:953 length:231 start_codon:yes stop_codon:yes gene_type:complete